LHLTASTVAVQLDGGGYFVMEYVDGIPIGIR